jgi:hypothetical protein
MINALSLTTPAHSSFFRSRPLRWRTKGVRFCLFRSSVHPNLLSPFPFINAVLPTNHLFGHHRP